MISRGLRYGILLSFACHSICAVLFTFSFGRVLPVPSLTETHFLGEFLNRWDISPEAFIPSSAGLHIREQAGVLLASSRSGSRGKVPESLPWAAIKPGRHVEIVAEKAGAGFFPVATPVREAPVITFYPQLSPDIMLYFRDRQSIHIELGYMMELVHGRPMVQVKRTVSSGNLEADLLSMRYISRSLFLHQVYLEPSYWYQAKIDLAVGSGAGKE